MKSHSLRTASATAAVVLGSLALAVPPAAQAAASAAPAAASAASSKVDSTQRAQRAIKYGNKQVHQGQVVINDGNVLGCHFYAKAAHHVVYQRAKNNALPRVTQQRMTTASSGCPLNGNDLTIQKAYTYSSGKYTVAVTQFKLRISIGIPTPWGVVGKSAEESGVITTRIHKNPKVKPWTGFTVTNGF